MEAISCNGNNLLEVLPHGKNPLQIRFGKIRSQFLLSVKPLELEGMKRRVAPNITQKVWWPIGKKKIPWSIMKKWLIDKGIIDAGYNEKVKLDYTLKVKKAVEAADALPAITFDEDKEVADLFAEHKHVDVPCSANKTEMRLIDAIHNGLKLAMQKHEKLDSNGSRYCRIRWRFLKQPKGL